MASGKLRLAVGALLFSISCGALAENAITNEPASVRAGPDDSYPEVAQLDADAPIQVMGCLDDWSWCDVTFDGNRGWMYSPDITYEYQGGYVPFYTYAPAFSIPVVSFTVDAYWGRYYHDRPWFRDRDQWAHREIRHRPPPGPPPRSGPPPREVVSRDRPHGGPPGDRSMRMGNSAPRGPEHAPPAPPARDDHAADHRNVANADHRADHPAQGSGTPERPVPPHSAPPPHPTPERAAPPERDAHATARPEPPRPEPQRAEHHDEPHPAANRPEPAHDEHHEEPPH